MVLVTLSLIAGLALLLWSAGQFVEGAAATARHFKLPPLLIGMVVVGFGTSAPEILVSALAAGQGNPGLALGNAYGSNIINIGVILGITALLHPIIVRSKILRKELPLLLLATAVAIWQAMDGMLTRGEAGFLVLLFAALFGWMIFAGMKREPDAFGEEMEKELQAREASLGRSLTRLVIGLLVLIGSSRILVWSAVEIAQAFGVSDLIIGLTVVAVGTSLPELASSVISARKGEHDIALGNVIGSNLFNTLVVVGLAGLIHPMEVGGDVLTRDMPVMAAFTLGLVFMGIGFRGPGRINRLEGGLLVGIYIFYAAFIVITSTVG